MSPPAQRADGDRPRHGFLRHVLDYGAVTVVQKAASLLMLPLYTRWLAEAEYGALALTDLVLIVLAELFGRHLLAGMSRHYFERAGERERRAVVSSTTLAVVAAAWLACGAGFLFRGALTPLLLGGGDSTVGPERLERLLALVLLILPCQLTSQAGFAYLQIRRRSGLFAGIQLAKTAGELALKVVLLGVLGLGVEGFLASVLAGEALTAVLLTGAVLSRVGLSVERAALGPVLRFALPLVPVGAFQLGLHQLDRRLVEHLAPGDLGLTFAGVYGLGYLIGATPIAVLLNAVFAIWQPALYAVRDPAARGRALAVDTTFALVAAAGACALTALLGKPLVELLAGREGYRAAYRVVPLVACGYAFWALYVSIQLGFYAERKTRDLVGLNLGALLANVVLCFALVPHFGIAGAAAATLLTFALLAGTAALVGRRACPAPLAWGRIGAALGVAALAAGAAAWIDASLVAWPLAASLGLRAAVLAAAAAALYFGLLGRGEREKLRARLAALRGGRGE